MRQDLDAALVRDFPNLYRDRHGDTRDTRMCDGFSCGDGWEPLIRRLSAQLEPLLRGTSLRASQVKQKFGSLRFYMTTVETLPPPIEGAIEAATAESERICEQCGDAGQKRDVDGCVQTLCAPCFDVELRASRARDADAAAPRRAREAKLIAAIKSNLPALEELLAQVDSRRAYGDLVYRFYHQSFKVYLVQQYTTRIADALRGLLPDAPPNDWFAAIVAEGTGREFQMEDNERWLELTRPMLEAFFHAKYFLEMVCEYGRELDEPPQIMPSGWAAVLYLYGLR